MQVTKKNLTDTSVQLAIVADRPLLKTVKEHVTAELGTNVKVPGFRAGKAPTSLLERQLDPNKLQAQFLDEAINQLYIEAAREKKLRPVAQPEISITKFVPFDVLELTATVDAVGDITLPDYKKIKVAKKPVSVTAKDVDELLERLRLREADKKIVKRAAKDGDEIVIDFNGVDAKTKEPIAGADGKDYPLLLGSNSFIPGFEPELIGLASGREKTFTLIFPADYAVSALQKRKVIFTVKVKQVQTVEKSKLDDKFAAKIGPFKTVAELKADIKKQLSVEQQRLADQTHENDLVTKIAEATEVAIPKALVDDQLRQMEQDERQNLTYRGQTWEEHLKSEGVTEEEHRERNRPDALLRVKIGLSLSEIAEQEDIQVTREELESRLMILKQQYPDAKMQAELDRPENRQDIFNRIVTEKTLERLKG